MNRAFGANASSVPIAENRALALLNLGRLDDAIKEYQRLLPQAPELRLTVARLLLARNLSRPPDRRNWSDLDALLRDAPESLRKTVDFPLLNIDSLLAQEKNAEAEEKAKTTRNAHPKEVRCWLVLAFLAERKEKEDSEKARAALRVLDAAEKEVGDCAELRLARVTRQLYGKKREEGADVLRAMERGADALPQANRLLLVRGLAELQARIGNAKDAIRLWRQVAVAAPHDLNVRQVLFDLAVGADDKAEIDRVLAEVHAIEGPEGALWRYDEAVLQIEASRKGGDREGLLTARARLAEIAKIRPNWARVPMALATIDEVEGNIDGAIEKYREAIRRGERQPNLVRHTVELLMGRRQFKEAREILLAIQEQNVVAGDLARLNAEVSLMEKSSRERGLELAKQAVPPDSRNYRDHLWLGQVYWVNDRKPEAEKAFRKALELNDTVPETWIALVGFLAGTEHKPEAEAELRNAQGKLKPEVVPLVLAPCYEGLGKRKEAEEQHLVLLKGSPNDPTRLRSAAQFYLRGGQTKEAEPVLLRLTQLRQPGTEEAAAWGRRTLALVLASSGDYRRSGQALNLLAENASRRNEPEDERARAMVQAMRPGERQRSIKTLEESFVRLPPTPYERFLLARLYEANRETDKAYQTLQDLRNSEEARENTFFLAHSILFLLRNNKVNDAEGLLVGLEMREPQTPRSVELRARVLRQGNGTGQSRQVGGCQIGGRPLACRTCRQGVLPQQGTGTAHPGANRFASGATGAPQRSGVARASLCRRNSCETARERVDPGRFPRATTTAGRSPEVVG